MATLRTLASVGSVRGRVTKLRMLLGKCDRWPVGVGVWLSVPCVVSRLACFLVLRPRRNRTLSRNRKERRQLLRDLHPRHPYLRRLRVGSNR